MAFGSDMGTSTGSSMGTFKVANNLGKLPAGGATMKGVAGLTGRATNVSLKHSTTGLAKPRPFMAKIRPVRNEMKSIGRKRGY